MGGFNTSSMTDQQNPQQAAANQVKATAGSSPSLGSMQQGMGGLLSNDTQQGAFDGFFGGLMDTFKPYFGQLMDRGEGHIDGGQPQSPTEPGLSPYEARIKELMTNRGMSRDQAVANQAGAMDQGGDINNNGAITNDEWARKLGGDFDNDGSVTNQEFAKWKQQNPDHQAAGGTKFSGLPGQNGLFSGQVAPAQQQPAAATPDNAPTNLFELPEKTQNAIANLKKFGGIFR
jgi:hypothetical protein